MNVKDRLIEFIKFVQKTDAPNISSFEKGCGLANAYVKSIRKSIGPESLEKILAKYPQLNKIWLLHGEGDMINSSKEPEQQQQQQKENMKADETTLQAIIRIASANESMARSQELMAQSNKDLTDMLKEERNKHNPTDQEDKRKHLAVLTRIAALEEFLLERLSEVQGKDIEELSEAFDTKFDTLAKRNIESVGSSPI